MSKTSNRTEIINSSFGSITKLSYELQGLECKLNFDKLKFKRNGDKHLVELISIK